MNEKESKNKKDADETGSFADELGETGFEKDCESGEEVVKKIKKLREHAEKLQKEKQHYLDALQRAKADFVNMRRRDEEDKRLYLKNAKKDFILEILTVVDAFDSAFSNKDKWRGLPEVWRRGIENIHAKLLAILSKEGVSEINPEKETFNPTEHTAVGIIETKNEEEDEVIGEVVEKGYSLDGKVIRSPKVKIMQYKNE